MPMTSPFRLNSGPPELPRLMEGGDRAAEPERVADGDHPFADPQVLRIAELDRLERLVRLNLQDGEVRLLIAPEDLGLELLAVVQNDVDLVGVGDHVIVGDHDALRIDHEPGAERVDPARPAIWRVPSRPTAVLEEFLEELLERRAGRQLRGRAAARFDLLRGRDVDYRVDHLLGDVGNRLRAARRRRRAQQRQRNGRPRNHGNGGL